MVKLSLMVALCSMVLLGEASAFSRKAPEPGPIPEPKVVAAETVWITRPDGAQSCAAGTGQSLEDGAAELRKSNVRIMQSRKGSDGKMHMQMCGAPTGATNAYLVPKEDLSRAVAMGFVPAK